VSRTAVGLRLRRSWEDGPPAGASPVMALLEAAYRVLVRVRVTLYELGVFRTRALPCPVVSIGNLTVGGTGKTPAVELAVRTLIELGRRPAVVSRGYRRRTRGIQIVADTASIRLEAEDAGDEPFLLARRLPGVPVVVGANRHAASRLAIERFGATAIVLDDGFQHRTVRKDLEIVMARAPDPWGNGCLLPRGPLREPLTALARAGLVVVVASTAAHETLAVEREARRHAPSVPVLAAQYAPVECWEAGTMAAVPLGELAGARLLAFAGIAAPGAFQTTLAALGVDVVDCLGFMDHHWYTAADLADLQARAVAREVDGLVTTEKDWVRLRTMPPPARPLYVVSIRLDLVTGHAEWRAAFERVCQGR
jgi:tetraacyldisaccharide 4'-kinase